MNTHSSNTTCHIVMTLLVLGSFVAARAHANDATNVDHRRSKATERRLSDGKPRIGRGMALDDAFALKFAYRGAVKRLEKEASCRALFDDLALDGLQALSRTEYRPVHTASENAHCVGGVAAYTAVGANRVLICSHFHTLHRLTKAAVLIHEALHIAGMSEAPLHPDSMTATEIEEMVEEACGLSN